MSKKSHSRILRHIQVSSDIFRHIQELFSHIQELFWHTQAYSEPFVILEYSETWYIQNPCIFRTGGIHRTLVYSVPEPYSEPCSFLRIWLHLLKKCLMENFIFCTVKNNITLMTLLTLSVPVSWGIRKQGIKTAESQFSSDLRFAVFFSECIRTHPVLFP